MVRVVCVTAVLLSVLALAPPIRAAENFITLASTTSTENSGLFSFLLPAFEQKTGIDVRVIAVGTGQAIRIARNGDADLLLVHHPASEKKFVADGYGVERRPVMHNSFIIIGPEADRANIKGLRNASDGLSKIAAVRALFASRGDESGTHRTEKSLWRQAGLNPHSASGTWYREMGSGMGATLNAAVAMGAYTLTDQASWAGFRNKGTHRILVEGDPVLFNQYSVILVNPAKHKHVKAGPGRQFINWITSTEGQARIAAYRINGQQMFFPGTGTARAQ